MTRVRLWLVCAWLLVCAGAVARAQSVALPTAASYAKALGTVQTALTRQSALLRAGVSAAPDSIPIERLAHQLLNPFLGVAVPGGAPQPANNTVLEQALHRAASLPNAQKRAAAYAQAAGQIAELRADILENKAGSTPKSAQASVRAVLGRAEFASDPLPPPSLWERLSAWLERLFSRLHRPSGPSPSISPAFIKTLLILVAAGAFALLVAALVQYLRQRMRPQSALALTEEEEALVEARDADSLRALAEEQGRQGEWRRAFRLTYLATLVALDTHGTLRFDRSKTNWEYLRALRAAGQGETYAALLPFTREFDRIWYGGAQAIESDYAYASAQYAALTRTTSVASAAGEAVSS